VPDYEPVIGLEIHAQVLTRSKMFCPCSAAYAGTEANTHVCALCAGRLRVVRGLGRVSARRIWALSRLSFKEAIRRRVLWVFSILIVVFLFASWFIPAKPEHQVSTYISVVDTVMTSLLLLSAVLLASFGIPNDIKQQTIHTILTKPVERFEIVLGRFLGYASLLTLVLVAMTGFSLLYLVWEVDPDAAAESLKARDPLWGELHFKDTESESKGINVGKEWDYRSYIAYPMPGQQGGTAIWDFDSAGATTLAGRNPVRCAYTFDVFRSTKGYENQGVHVKFAFRTWHSKPGNEHGEDYQAELDRRGRTEHGDTDGRRDRQLDAVRPLHASGVQPGNSMTSTSRFTIRVFHSVMLISDSGITLGISRCGSAWTKSALTSSGITYARPCTSAYARASCISCNAARGLAPRASSSERRLCRTAAMM